VDYFAKLFAEECEEMSISLNNEKTTKVFIVDYFTKCRNVYLSQ